MKYWASLLALLDCLSNEGYYLNFSGTPDTGFYHGDTLLVLLHDECQEYFTYDPYYDKRILVAKIISECGKKGVAIY